MGEKSNGKWVNGAGAEQAWRSFEKMAQGSFNPLFWVQATMPMMSMLEGAQRESIKAAQTSCKTQAEALQRFAVALNSGAVTTFWTTLDAMIASCFGQFKALAEGEQSKPMDLVSQNIQAWQDTAQRIMVDTTKISQATTEAFQEMVAYREPKSATPPQSL